MGFSASIAAMFACTHGFEKQTYLHQRGKLKNRNIVVQ